MCIHACLSDFIEFCSIISNILKPKGYNFNLLKALGLFGKKVLDVEKGDMNEIILKIRSNKMKKKLIIAAIVIAIIVGVMLYMHYTPFWVNLTTVVSFGVGVVAGWVARLVYDKYFKEDAQNESID